MPFDGLPTNPEKLAHDIRILHRLAHDIRLKRGWIKNRMGLPASRRHCLYGWLLMATAWNEDKAERIAETYLYPEIRSLMPVAELTDLFAFNDNATHERVVTVVKNAIVKATLALELAV